MPSTEHQTRRTNKLQRGAAALEFALVVGAFSALLTGVTEMGRYLYMWNTVQEVTRRAARFAVVQGFSAGDVDAVQRYAVFHAGEGGKVTVPGAPQVASSQVRLRYLDANMNEVESMPADPDDNLAACLDASRQTTCIRYVEASVCRTQASPCVPVEFDSIFGVALRIPPSSVVMAAESLGR
ncbi:MAG: pilus assembly protein [Deltaproteobacteria bacterium]|nr:pilus assembly protein [Deltaproteobacteria bacterium]